MNKLLKFGAIMLSMISFSACQKDIDVDQYQKTGDIPVIPQFQNKAENGFGPGSKKVYTLNNQVSGNAVMEYDRAGNGMLTFNAAYSTGGTGTGGGLGNQGAIILTMDDKTLLAVNPGSNSISSFKITNNGLSLISTVNSGGTRPVSITESDDIVFVLNAGGSGNISGFKLDDHELTPIPNSTRPLSSPSAGPAQISFVKNGKVVVITEKATNKIITYTISNSGNPGMMHSILSSTPTPFGFELGKDNGIIIVSEADGGAPGASKLSSYEVNETGNISLITGSVGAGQSAACWVVVTNNGKYAYTTNTASNNLSSFDINKHTGGISVNTPIASTTGMGPIDAALSDNSKYLYVLNSGGHSIGVYTVANNGGLSLLQTQSGIPAGATGLAAR